MLPLSDHPEALLSRLSFYKQAFSPIRSTKNLQWLPSPAQSLYVLRTSFVSGLSFKNIHRLPYSSHSRALLSHSINQRSKCRPLRTPPALSWPTLISPWIFWKWLRSGLRTGRCLSLLGWIDRNLMPRELSSSIQPLENFQERISSLVLAGATWPWQPIATSSTALTSACVALFNNTRTKYLIVLIGRSFISITK